MLAWEALVDAERRQVTVLFADMVGFTSISEQIGEEGVFALIKQIYELMAGAVLEQGGSVKDFTGDGIMALFGVPDALEDAPLRACRAGLAIHERLAAAAPAIEARHGVRPQMRIGVNSGATVVTQIRSESAAMTALGDTVNLASRLQTLAEPGTAFLSEATHRLVQGMVDATFAGSHAIKGKAEPQNVYRLDALRKGATRFEAAIGRGLTTYVGRERELDTLDRALAEARAGLRVVDIVAEPGMGKSRLLYEFRQRVGKERAFFLAGNGSPDGRQTPFLPFIEVVRGSFQVQAGEAEAEITRKLDSGLNVLGLPSLENLGLLLNLLGLKPPEGSLTGLDGVLIGLRTRDLLESLLAARCRLSPVVLLIEDLHWIDSVSQELLGKIIEDEADRPLLVLHTRRPEYAPPWFDKPAGTALRLEPLPTGDIRRLIQARLGVDALPEALVQLVTEKAEGNALFAEEILSFCAERGVLRTVAGSIEFDASAVAAALPARVQSLLTARVDRLAPKDRALLQAAAVIGRRFNPQLLAAVADDPSDFEARLARMMAHDLIHSDAKSGEYAFKHALVRDALYQSLLKGARAAFHLKIAEEIERRSGNRLTEVVEALAHHFGQTDRVDKAFVNLASAGAKSLAIYALDEAGSYLDTAAALLDRNPNCATDQQVAYLLANFVFLSNLTLRLKTTLEIVDRFAYRLDGLGDDPTRVLIDHHRVIALLWSGRYQEAKVAQVDLTAMAARLRDNRSKVYALASAIHGLSFATAAPIGVFDALSREAIEAAKNVDDGYIQCFVRFVIGWEYFHLGLMSNAHAAGKELIEVGRKIRDPRSLGLGMRLHSWVALTNADYSEALKYAESSLVVACSPNDAVGAKLAKFAALVLLRQSDALLLFRGLVDTCRLNDWHWYETGADGIWGAAMVIEGRIGNGLRWIEKSIIKREKEGYVRAADWYRLLLCEIYLEIIAGPDKPPTKVILQNIVTLSITMYTAARRIEMLIERVRRNSQFDPNGQIIGRCEMILGLLYKVKKKRPQAIQHLTEAKRIISQFGPSPMLTKIETALAEAV